MKDWDLSWAFPRMTPCAPLVVALEVVMVGNLVSLDMVFCYVEDAAFAVVNFPDTLNTHVP